MEVLQSSRNTGTLGWVNRYIVFNCYLCKKEANCCTPYIASMADSCNLSLICFTSLLCWRAEESCIWCSLQSSSMFFDCIFQFCCSCSSVWKFFNQFGSLQLLLFRVLFPKVFIFVSLLPSVAFYNPFGKSNQDFLQLSFSALKFGFSAFNFNWNKVFSKFLCTEVIVLA